MATGYTSKLHDGEPQSFEEFVASCAYAFGALVEYRDSAPREDLPERAEVRDYYAKQVHAARQEVERYLGMTEEEAAEAERAERTRYNREREKALREKAAIQLRYELMLMRVRGWEPPTAEHEELKRFMVEQLESSIRFDCNMDGFTAQAPQRAEEWLAARLAWAQDGLERAIRSQQEEIERVESRNRWVKELRDSLEACGADEF